MKKLYHVTLRNVSITHDLLFYVIFVLKQKKQDKKKLTRKRNEINLDVLNQLQYMWKSFPRFIVSHTMDSNSFSRISSWKVFASIHKLAIYDTIHSAFDNTVICVRNKLLKFSRQSSLCWLYVFNGTMNMIKPLQLRSTLKMKSWQAFHSFSLKKS